MKIRILLFMIVYILVANSGIAQNPTLIKKAEKGDVESQYLVGVDCFKKGKPYYKEAVYWFQKAAWQDYKAAYIELAYCYENGFGVEKNDSMAVEYFKLAAPYSNGNVQCDLAYHYEKGIGTSVNYTEAFYWYKKAALQGSVIAMNNLASLYRYGEGVKKDEKQSFYWQKKAAEQGDPVCIYNFATYYQYGTGTEKDEAQAFLYFKKAAELGYADAQYELAFMYNYGIGIMKDYNQAIYWYKKNIEQTDASRAKYALAVLLYKQKSDEAFFYLLKAENSTYMNLKARGEIRRLISACYRFGRYGCPKIDIKRADEWMAFAAECGDANAEDIMKWLKSN